MHIARFSDGNNPTYGIVEDGSNRIIGLRGDPLFAPVEPSGRFFQLDEVRLLSPVIPRSKVVCIGKNYADHIAEFDGQKPAAPIIFIKPNTAVIGPDDPIVLPKWAQVVHHEVELGIVIKTICKDVEPGDVGDFILGYTIGNDCSERIAQKADGQWTRAKGWDTSCPLGPWITVNPELDPNDLDITCAVNGEVRQSSNTGAMIYNVAEVVSYVSQAMTLLPGDVILTGTPAGVGPLQDGDRVTCAISGIGEFTNPVLASR